MSESLVFHFSPHSAAVRAQRIWGGVWCPHAEESHAAGPTGSCEFLSVLVLLIHIGDFNFARSSQRPSARCIKLCKEKTKMSFFCCCCCNKRTRWGNVSKRQICYWRGLNKFNTRVMYRRYVSRWVWSVFWHENNLFLCMCVYVNFLLRSRGQKSCELVILVRSDKMFDPERLKVLFVGQTGPRSQG